MSEYFVHTQVCVKGGDGNTVKRVSDAQPLPVAVISGGGGGTTPYSPGALAITTSGAAYIAGDCVGGIISIPTVNLSTGRRVALKGLTINDKGGVAPSLNIYFFPSTPTGGTYTDNAPLVWGSLDNALCCGHIQVLNGDYITDASQSGVTYGSLNIELDVTATTLYMIVVGEGNYMINNGNLSIRPEFNQE